jgi:glutathionyl-hydroquinone reductase
MSAKPQFPGEQDAGEFKRQEDAFRQWISSDGSTAFPAVRGRYHLYVSLACPWATRTALLRSLLGLTDAIGMTVVDPVRDEHGWAFRDGPGFSKDPVNGFAYLSEAYKATDPHFRGRFTVPVLWDRETNRIVNNSEDDICRMFNDAFRHFDRAGVDFFPAELHGEQEKLSSWIYEYVNNGVYRAGFATRQAVYERACRELFEALDGLEDRLRTARYLFGDRIVETDWRLFNTLVRFDAVYYVHFKCNLRRIADYPNLQGYLQDLYQQPGVAEWIDFDHIKRHYYVTHTDINPHGIVPLGPLLDLSAPHGRERLAGSRHVHSV